MKLKTNKSFKMSPKRQNFRAVCIHCMYFIIIQNRVDRTFKTLTYTTIKLNTMIWFSLAK